jgi:hypothetical protein
VVLEHLRLSSYSAGNMMTVEAHPHDLPTRRAKGRAGNMANEVPAADEVVDGSCERGRAWASFDAALADEKRTMPRMAELLTGEVQIQWRISFFGEDKGPLDRFLAQIDLAGGGGGVRQPQTIDVSRGALGAYRRRRLRWREGLSGSSLLMGNGEGCE